MFDDCNGFYKWHEATSGGRGGQIQLPGARFPDLTLTCEGLWNFVRTPAQRPVVISLKPPLVAVDAPSSGRRRPIVEWHATCSVPCESPMKGNVQEAPMFMLMIALSATGVVVGVCLGLVRRKQQVSMRRALGLPEGAFVTFESTQWQRALRDFTATEARISKGSPHLSATQRRELAVKLIRARGSLTAEDRRNH
jgi:hypothetical protein